MKKKIQVLLLILSIMFTMIFSTSCGTVEITTYDLDEDSLAVKLLDDVKYDCTLYQVRDKKISNYITSNDCKYRIMFMGNGTCSDQFAIFTTNTSEEALALTEKVKTYLNETADSYRQYIPVETAKIEMAVVENFGKYVIYCVTSDYEKAKSIIDSTVVTTVTEVSKKELKNQPIEEDNNDEPQVVPVIDDRLAGNYPVIQNDKEALITKYSTVFVVGDKGYEIYNYGTESATKYANIINDAADSLKGISNVYDLIVPLGSGIVLPDELYDSLGYSNQRAAINEIEKMLSDDVTLVNPYDNLMNHRDEYIYFKTDHHWTQLGAYYAYEVLCEKMGILPIALEKHKTNSFSGFIGSFYNDSNKNTALYNNPDTINVYYPVSENAEMHYTTSSNKTYKWSIINDVTTYPAGVKYSTFTAGDNPYTIIENKDLTDGSACIVVKESFGNCFVPFLVDHYQTIYEIDYRYYSGNIVELAEENNVDDVIFINNLSGIRNSYLIGKMSEML